MGKVLETVSCPVSWAGALTALPVLGMWALPAFPAPRGHPRDTALRERWGDERPCTAQVSEPSEGLSRNFKGLRPQGSTHLAAAQDKPQK